MKGAITRPLADTQARRVASFLYLQMSQMAHYVAQFEQLLLTDGVQ